MTHAASPLPAVAHVMECFLSPTETFIHDYLVAFRSVRPVVIARQLANQERFPLPAAAVVRRSPPRRGTIAWAVSALARRVQGGNPHMRRILRREGVRLMHAHFGPTACGLLDMRREVGLPLVTSFYGYDVSIAGVLKEFNDAYRRLFDLGDAFLVEGSAMRRTLETLGCPSSRIRIQRIAVDPSRYRFAERSEPGGGEIVILQCGRMVPKKGFPETVKAFAKVRARHPRARLRLVGDGPERPRVEEAIRALDLGAAVTLTGALSREALFAEMDRAHIYVQASRVAPDGDSEGGAPTTLLEAQACGLPVLSTLHADIPEIVQAGRSALLVPEGDADALATEMERLVARPDLWGAMGRAGRAHIEENHDVRRRARELEILYARLAETGRLPPS